MQMTKRWMLWATGMALTALSACAPANGDDDFEPGVEVPLEGLCFEACTALDECGTCEQDNSGQCYGRAQCIEVCEGDAETQARYACLVGTSSCSGPLDQCGGFCGAAQIEACLDGSVVSGCHQACGFMEACEACVNDTDGNCLSVAGCIESCERGEAADGFNCVQGLNNCDGGAIAQCFAGDRPDPGEDACARGCVALDDCELCLETEEEECLDVEQCVATCRGVSDALDADRAQCIADLQACDAEGVSACLAAEPDPGDDACGRGCSQLDTCNLCLPDENDECLTPVACAEACRGGEAAEGLACVAELNACDEDAISTCLDTEPGPGDDDCGLGCARLDECGYCLPDESDECLSPAACAEACRGGESAAGLLCISKLEVCEEDAVNACLAEEPAQAPSCELYCQRRVECDAVPEVERPAAITACVEECTAEDDAALRTCYVDADTCEAATECLPASPEPEPPVDGGAEPEPPADAGVEPEGTPDAGMGD